MTPRSRCLSRELEARGVQDFDLPLYKIAEEQGGHKIMMNTAAIGAMAGLADFEFEWIANVLQSNFRRKGTDAVNSNLKVADYAYKLAQDQYGDSFRWKLRPGPAHPSG